MMPSVAEMVHLHQQHQHQQQQRSITNVNQSHNILYGRLHKPGGGDLLDDGEAGNGAAYDGRGLNDDDNNGDGAAALAAITTGDRPRIVPPDPAKNDVAVDEGDNDDDGDDGDDVAALSGFLGKCFDL
jgi:hypothetical protein